MLPSNLIESKLIFVGEISVGKSALIHYYLNNKFNPKTESTIGGMYLQKKINVHPSGSTDPIKIVMNIWDTHGEERFRSLQKIYYRGVSYACICTSFWSTLENNPKDSQKCNSLEKMLESIQYWYNDIKKHSENENNDVKLIVIITKMDLIRKNPEQMSLLIKIKEYVNKIDALYFQTSAKEGDGVEELFDFIVQHIVSKRTKRNETEKNTNLIKITQENKYQEQQTRSCCSSAPQSNEWQE